MKEDGFAGLVGTNTITQNYSREGSLDYIVSHQGEIFSAVSSVAWSGEAVVTVSIVCWKKGKFIDKKELYVEDKNQDLIRYTVDEINSSLSLELDVTNAQTLKCNKIPKKVFQGQVPGLDGYLINKTIGLKLIRLDKKNKQVLIPHLIAEELIGDFNSQPRRFLIDFSGMDIIKANSYKEVFKILEKEVLPYRERDAKQQEEQNKSILEKDKLSKVNKHHLGAFLKSGGNLHMEEKIS